MALDTRGTVDYLVKTIEGLVVDVVTLKSLNNDLQRENERLKAELESWVESQT